MSKTIWFLMTVLVLSAPASAARGPSTPEERQRLVNIAHQLEVAPLDASLQPERAWAIGVLADVPDISVTVCLSPLGDFNNTNHPHAAEITIQLMLSEAAFEIEHPAGADDPANQLLAGVEGALKVYNAILTTDPTARAPALDALVQKQHDSQLADFVREASKSCK